MSRNSLLTKSHYIVSKDNMPDKWTNVRLLYIKKLQAHTPTHCPECDCELTIDDEQIYCPECGLVTQDSTEYVASIKYHLPHGLRLG
jgi:uncharacterized Zn finger protein (UPF0148 family)